MVAVSYVGTDHRIEREHGARKARDGQLQPERRKISSVESRPGRYHERGRDGLLSSDCGMNLEPDGE
jgi:hypothetical protein